MKLEGEIAVVTGGANGLGKCYVRHLLERQAKVCIADINEELGQQATAELSKQFGDHVTYVKCDVTKTEDIKNALGFAIATFNGPVRIWINNAGILGATKETWEKCIDINLKAVIESTYIALAYMRKDRETGGVGGVIVNIASVAGLNIAGGAGVYFATKHGVSAFTKSEALYLSEFSPDCGVRVCCLCPPYVKTDLIDFYKPEELNQETSQVVLFNKYGGWNETDVVAQGLISLVEREDSHGVLLIPSKNGTKQANLVVEEKDW